MTGSQQEQDKFDRNFTHLLRHAPEMSDDERQKEIIRHAIAHDLLRLPISGFTCSDARTGRVINIAYDPEHPLNKDNGVDLIYSTNQERVAELIIVPKQPNVKIINVMFSYDVAGDLKDFELIPQPFQRDPNPEPFDFSHHFYRVTKGQANVDPLFKFIRILERNTSVQKFRNTEREEAYRRSIQRGEHRVERPYQPPEPVIRSRYVPREARAPETVVSVGGSN